MTDRNDDTDRRFRELIRAEFGNVAGANEPGDADPSPPFPHPSRRNVPLPDPIDYFNLSDAIDRAVPDDETEHWDPPVDASPIHLPRRAMVGGVIVAVGLLLGIAAMAGVRLPLAGGIATVACIGAGMALLLSTLPLGQGRDDGGDGAQL
ncbi:hypothetical protein [Brooklawnia cerclae]|uniref:DUF2335 domain-containing protein n=1 Tax=Brooklawnia cerclae TaxID=349934 RepID=A0ABX0SJR0_9ACTN|nr:hypothetical protein [Brooklawnia cerclae]NIH57548.1 hypothetical protein [Brooklawnia cerclae]